MAFRFISSHITPRTCFSDFYSSPKNPSMATGQAGSNISDVWGATMPHVAVYINSTSGETKNEKQNSTHDS